MVLGLVEARPYAIPLRLGLVERHPLGEQAFFPLNAAPFLVVVCPNEDGGPGFARRAFVARAPPQGLLRARDLAPRADTLWRCGRTPSSSSGADRVTGGPAFREPRPSPSPISS